MLNEQTLQILLVDPMLDQAQRLKRICLPLGTPVLHTTRGEEALKIVLQHQLAVIIIANTLEDMSGTDLLTLMQNMATLTRLPASIYYTESLADSRVLEAYALGASDCIVHSCSDELFRARLMVLLRMAEQFRQLDTNLRRERDAIVALNQDVVSQQAHLKVTIANLETVMHALQETQSEMAVIQQTAGYKLSQYEQLEQEYALLLVRELQARNNVQDSEVVRERFLAVAAHELRTPLTSLIGHTQLLKRRIQRATIIDERLVRNIDVIELQAQRMKRLIDDLLLVSRLSYSDLALSYETCNVPALCEQLIDYFSVHGSSHRFILLVQDPIQIEADPLRLEQIIHGLLHNAVMYSPSETDIRIRIEQTEQSVLISVEDQGIGIPVSSQPYIFEQFFRGENAKTWHVNGLGLGLYIVRQMVDLHGGNLEFESSEGQGSCFRLSLPCEKPLLADAVGNPKTSVTI
jgi:signal transduction histidine kinase